MIEIRVHHDYPGMEARLREVEHRLGLLVKEIQHMANVVTVDMQKLLDAVARLELDDKAAVTALTILRDQNKAAQAQIADLSAQLAAGGDTSAIKTALDDIADRLGKVADDVEASVKNNVTIPDLPPATP